MVPDPSSESFLLLKTFVTLKQGTDGELFPMCGVFPFATRTQPVKHEGYVKVSKAMVCISSVDM